MNLSLRMETVVSLVSPQSFAVADVGCDHAYVSIALIERGLASKVIAMDVRKGPLEIAEANITNSGLHNVISLRLSDGLEKLKPGEADTIILAGMGGLLITEILERGQHIIKDSKPSLILQPQSELSHVRQYILQQGYIIEEEKMLVEEGKYYTVIKAVPSEDSNAYVYTDADYVYGYYNIVHHNPILYRYLEKERNVLTEIYDNLRIQREKMLDKGKEMPEKTQIRMNEIMQELARNEEAMQRYKEVEA